MDIFFIWMISSVPEYILLDIEILVGLVSPSVTLLELKYTHIEALEMLTVEEM